MILVKGRLKKRVYFNKTSIHDEVDQRAAKNRTSKPNGDTQTSFNYALDKLGRRIKETITYRTNNKIITKVLHYSYDMDGNLANITYPDGGIVNITMHKDY